MSSAPEPPHGLLRAHGSRIVGADGEAVSLAGMSLFWSQWMPQYYTAETVAWLKSDWKSGVVRAAIAADQGGYRTQPESEWAKACAVVDAAIDQGLYVIVDWHTHHAEDHPDQAVEFFSRLAEKYGQAPNLIYEIYNEPLRVSWSSVIKPYAERVIAAIRKYDPDNLIVVGTPFWSQNVDDVIPDPLKDANVAYTLHFYAGTHKAELRARAQKAVDAGLALVVTEWGSVNANGDGEWAEESVNEWLAWMRKNRMIHCNWSIADKVEGASALKPGASGSGGWKDADLTPNGLRIREIIRGWETP
jgi:endoglucanase